MSPTWDVSLKVPAETLNFPSPLWCHKEYQVHYLTPSKVQIVLFWHQAVNRGLNMLIASLWGPSMKRWRVQGVTPSSPQDSWDWWLTDVMENRWIASVRRLGASGFQPYFSLLSTVLMQPSWRMDVSFRGTEKRQPKQSNWQRSHFTAAILKHLCCFVDFFCDNIQTCNIIVAVLNSWRWKCWRMHIR